MEAKVWYIRIGQFLDLIFLLYKMKGQIGFCRCFQYENHSVNSQTLLRAYLVASV